MMRYVSGCFVAAVAASAISSCQKGATIEEQAEQISQYKYALAVIGQDMQINYALQQATLADLTECRAAK